MPSTCDAHLVARMSAAHFSMHILYILVYCTCTQDVRLALLETSGMKTDQVDQMCNDMVSLSRVPDAVRAADFVQVGVRSHRTHRVAPRPW